ncbi:hypothetical protein CLV98_10551 [Dyadobacter jejuensis]|uniref:Lipoprotein n=2 Tax=Dyadobacter jejuensis TaxID=1082580 RepID=A0A316AJT7_9BACT|nr:hypothetical protein CLV98_10551 [Dyadobacter jejuensis]
MKNQKNTSLYAFTLVIWLTMIGCDKGPYLTPITQEGKNTFSCKVNGKVWVPKGRGDIFVIIKPIYAGFPRNHVTDSLGVSIDTYAANGEEIHIFLRTLEIGKHKLFKDTYPQYISFNPENYGLYRGAENVEYITSSSQTGYVFLTHADTLSGIIAGTFEFTVADSNGNKISISDGRFDVNRKTL